MALQDYYNAGDDGSYGFYGTSWWGQTFTTASDYTISSVKLLLYRQGTVSSLTVSIRATSSNLPTGADLASGTIDVSALTTNTAGAWTEIAFTVPYALSSGVKYAIVCRDNGTSSSNRLYWRRDGSSPSYAGGNVVYSTNSGSSWAADTASDHMFETYSSDPIDHEISGSVAVAAGQTGNLTGTFGIVGSTGLSLSLSAPLNFIMPISGVSALSLALSSFLSSNINVGGAIPITLACNAPRLFKMFKLDHTVPLRRLIAAGSNRIYYEVL